MRTIKTTSGTAIDLDDDVLAILEKLSLDLHRRQELDYGFEDIDREIQHLVDQMSDEELRTYLKESLFMSFNRFENERLNVMIRKANDAEEE
jgi:phage gp29-like protein